MSRCSHDMIGYCPSCCRDGVIDDLRAENEALRQRVQVLEERDAYLEEIVLRGVLGYLTDAKVLIEEALESAQEDSSHAQETA